MRFEIVDERTEHRRVRSTRDEDGIYHRNEEHGVPSRYGAYRLKNYEHTYTTDTRDVTVTFEDDDPAWRTRVLSEGKRGNQTGDFFVDTLRVKYSRKYDNSDDRGTSRWVRDWGPRVHGANRRKDGSRGVQSGGLYFPVVRYTGSGRTVEPLPQWIWDILAKVNPDTGLAFDHPVQHRFGDFDDRRDVVV